MYGPLAWFEFFLCVLVGSGQRQLLCTALGHGGWLCQQVFVCCAETTRPQGWLLRQGFSFNGRNPRSALSRHFLIVADNRLVHMRAVRPENVTREFLEGFPLEMFVRGLTERGERARRQLAEGSPCQSGIAA